VKAVKEATLREFLLALLRSARAGLRRKSIDEVNQLREICTTIPPEHRHLVPPEVVRFLAGFKRKRGRMRSKQAEMDAFWQSPNRVAAAIAASIVADLRGTSGRRSKRKGPHVLKDGKERLAPSGRQLSGTRIYDEAIREAKLHLPPWLRGKRVDDEVVRRHLEHGRVEFPADPFADDPNGWKN
jgi:hypothetical protein